MEALRVMLGGWTPGAVQAADVAGRLKVAGVVSVDNAHVKGNHAFATLHVSESPAAVLESLQAMYSRTVWRGGRLTVALASPDYMHRLREEWKALAEATTSPTPPQAPAKRLEVLRIRAKRGRRVLSVPATSVYEYVPGVCVKPDASCCVGNDAGPNTRRRAEPARAAKRLKPANQANALLAALSPPPPPSLPVAVEPVAEAAPPNNAPSAVGDQRIEPTPATLNRRTTTTTKTTTTAAATTAAKKKKQKTPAAKKTPVQNTVPIASQGLMMARALLSGKRAS